MTQRPEPRSKRAPSLMVRAIPTERRLGTSLIGHLEDLRRAYGALDGLALLRAVLREGPLAGRTALVSSFGAESAVLLDMVATIDPAIPVIFLDTGKLFEDNEDDRDELTRLLGLLRTAWSFLWLRSRATTWTARSARGTSPDPLPPDPQDRAAFPR